MVPEVFDGQRQQFMPEFKREAVRQTWAGQLRYRDASLGLPDESNDLLDGEATLLHVRPRG